MIITYLKNMIICQENSLVKELKENLNIGRNIVIFTIKLYQKVILNDASIKC